MTAISRYIQRSLLVGYSKSCERSLFSACNQNAPDSHKNVRTREMSPKEKEERNRIIKTYYQENKFLFGKLIKDYSKKEPEEPPKRIIKQKKEIKTIVRKQKNDQDGIPHSQPSSAPNSSSALGNSPAMLPEKPDSSFGDNLGRFVAADFPKDAAERAATDQNKQKAYSDLNSFNSNLLSNGSPIRESREAAKMLLFPLVSPIRKELQATVRQSCPSVSEVLQTTMPPESKKALEDWKNRMIAKHGEEGFEKIRTAMLEEGRNLHDCIHQYIEGSEDLQIPDSCSGYWKALEGVLPKVSQLQLSEESVSHPFLGYKGRVDCCALFNNELCVVEWKTSRRSRATLKQLYDYPLQAAAYIGAINASNTSVKVDKAVIVVAYQDMPAHVHMLEGSELTKYWRMWLQRLQRYWLSWNKE